jgi:hypothetical protein
MFPFTPFGKKTPLPAPRVKILITCAKLAKHPHVFTGSEQINLNERISSKPKNQIRQRSQHALTTYDASPGGRRREVSRHYQCLEHVLAMLRAKSKRPGRESNLHRLPMFGMLMLSRFPGTMSKQYMLGSCKLPHACTAGIRKDEFDFGR